jgi:hypothetical protein
MPAASLRFSTSRLTPLVTGLFRNYAKINFDAITQVRRERFDGERFETFGPVLSSAVS